MQSSQPSEPVLPLSPKLSRKKGQSLCYKCSAPALLSSRVPNSHLVYNCGDPGALDRALGSWRSRGDATLAWPACPCHCHPFPVCKEETLGSPSNAAAACIPMHSCVAGPAAGLGHQVPLSCPSVVHCKSRGPKPWSHLGAAPCLNSWSRCSWLKPMVKK